MEYFQIPRRQVTRNSGIARSTLHRWLMRIDDVRPSIQHPWNEIRESLATLVWRISRDNIDWGRVRIANQLKLLNVFQASGFPLIPATVTSIISVFQRSHSRLTGTTAAMNTNYYFRELKKLGMD